MALVDKIGIENVLNSILVNENVRPAMLVQPADHNEATGKDRKTKSIIKAIREQFPELVFSEKYETYQGVIISKTKYNGKNISLEKMGEILGYPCYREFNSIDPDKTSYRIDVIAVSKTGRNIQLFANKCKDKTKIEEFKEIARKAEIAINKEQYRHLLNHFEIDRIDVEIDEIIPTQQIINLLIENKPLQNSEKDKIQNILYNFGFSIEQQIMDHFQYTNPIHKGILLSLLVKEENDTLSPFFPLQKYPDQEKEVDEITKTWENDLIHILRRTEQKTTLKQKTKTLRKNSKWNTI
jgi:hypothetical protein